MCFVFSKGDGVGVSATELLKWWQLWAPENECKYEEHIWKSLESQFATVATEWIASVIGLVVAVWCYICYDVNIWLLRRARMKLWSVSNPLCPFGPSQTVRWTGHRPPLHSPCRLLLPNQHLRCRLHLVDLESVRVGTVLESPSCTE